MNPVMELDALRERAALTDEEVGKLAAQVQRATAEWQGRGAQHGQRRLGRRCLVPRLVAANAPADFARLEVHERTHPLEFHVVLVERLEKHAAAGRNREVGRTILFDGDDAVEDGHEDVRPQESQR